MGSERSIQISNALSALYDKYASNPKLLKSLTQFSQQLETLATTTDYLSELRQQRNCTEVLNLLLYMNISDNFTGSAYESMNELTSLISIGLKDKYASLQLSSIEIEAELGTDYLNPKLVRYDELLDTLQKSKDSNNASDSSATTSCGVLQAEDFSQNEHFDVDGTRVSIFSNILDQEDFNKSAELSLSEESGDRATLDADYWIRAVSFDTPFMPNCDIHKILYKTNRADDKFVIYGEAVKPWNQSMIGLATDVNTFSDDEVLKLFPEIRLYTRGNELYHPIDGLDFDEDLGVIFHIKGFTKKQMVKNIIEYPHIFQFDRWVRKNGDVTTIPFWKHIELNGQMEPISNVWGTSDLPDTKKLPKTPLFMNEYIMRKYILEENKGIEHKYKMRGELWPFLTLYAPPEYYERHGYDPLVVGRKCIEARQHLCMTRNPIINMHKDRLVDSKS